MRGWEGKGGYRNSGGGEQNKECGGAESSGNALSYARFVGDGVEVLIPFECRRCGKCCEEISRCVYLPVEKKLVMENLIVNFEIDVSSQKPVFVRCPFFDEESRLCTIYEVRPESCRNFPLLTDVNFDCPALAEVLRVAEELRKVFQNLSFRGKV